MTYEACRFAFDCLNSTDWWASITLWTLAGGGVVALLAWLMASRP
jgi:hypothetical protein